MRVCWLAPGRKGTGALRRCCMPKLKTSIRTKRTKKEKSVVRRWRFCIALDLKTTGLGCTEELSAPIIFFVFIGSKDTIKTKKRN